MKHIIDPLANYASEVGLAGKPRATVGNLLSPGLIEAEILEYILPELKLAGAIKKKEDLTNVMKTLSSFVGDSKNHKASTNAWACFAKLVNT